MVAPRGLRCASSVGGLTLQDLKVLNVGIFCVDVELDARHWEVSENAVENLAQSGTVSSQRFH